MPPLPAVRIRKHPEPIRVNYQVVRELVPKLWDGEGESSGEEGNSTTDGEEKKKKKPKIDLMLHLGMAGPRPYYTIERLGHRDGYRGRDVDEELLDDEERHRLQREGWIWHGLPHDLETDLDLDDVVERWRGYGHVSELPPARLCVIFMENHSPFRSVSLNADWKKKKKNSGMPT